LLFFCIHLQHGDNDNTKHKTRMLSGVTGEEC